MTEGLVSIITPCYNGSKYISQTIESVIAQTYKDWEMIIIDDGSKDNSAEIVEEYAKKDSRIILLKQANGGSAAARNNGIRNAKGQYIALLDADDLWEPEFLASQIECMKKNDAVCVYCSYRLIDADGSEIKQPVMSRELVTEKDMLITNYIGCLSGLYDSKKHGKIYLREEFKSIRDDYAYWCDIVKLEKKAYGNPEILASYRVLDNSTTGNKFKLIPKQYQFYRTYCKHGRIKSFYCLTRWALWGLKKYSGR